MSEIMRWKNLYMVEYYNNYPDKLKQTPDDITVEESQQSIMAFFAAKKGDS